MKQSRMLMNLFIVMVFMVSACSPAPKETTVPTNPPEPKPSTSSPLPIPTETLEPTITSSPTIEPTSESVEMEKLVQKLFEEKTIFSSEGTYHRMSDFSESWAQLYYYQWWYTDFSPSNFIIQADLEWESASKTPNLSDSGCGFVYHTEDAQNHHATFLMMDGKVQTYRTVKNAWTSLKAGSAGKFKVPADKAHMVLVVDKQWLTVIVNDKQVVHFQDTKLQGGKVGYTLASGTNKGFGTRCTMKNIELWELPE
ncbi:MAG TPA: hypothetical protein VF338_07415 [Leptolinea sp.]